jgi:phenylacetic acid degradation operon negative regulatory protein
MSSSRNAPLTARSVLASVLLGTDPPWLPTPLLVRTAALFGLGEGTVRTALSRMVAAGEAVGEGGGYRLAGSLVSRQRRQEASRRAEVRPWDGTWELATVDGDGRRSAADRAALRAALTALRLVELREGLWGRPDNLDPERSPESAAVVDRWCRMWRRARPSPAVGVEELWDLGGWGAGAHDLRGRMAALLPSLVEGDLASLADGFVVSAAVLRHLQADPLLPAELLGQRWPGDALRAEYDAYDLAYRRTLRRWFTAPEP